MPCGLSVAGYDFLKNVSSDLYLSIFSSEIEESNQVSRTLFSPVHLFFGKSAIVPNVFFVLASITSASFGGDCFHGSTYFSSGASAIKFSEYHSGMGVA